MALENSEFIYKHIERSLGCDWVGHCDNRRLSRSFLQGQYFGWLDLCILSGREGERARRLYQYFERRGCQKWDTVESFDDIVIDFWDAALVPSKCEVSLKEQNSNGNTGFCQKETTKIFGLCAKAKPSQKCQTTKEEQHVFSCSHFLHNFLSILFIIRFCHQTFTLTNSLKT